MCSLIHKNIVIFGQLLWYKNLKKKPTHLLHDGSFFFHLRYGLILIYFSITDIEQKTYGLYYLQYSVMHKKEPYIVLYRNICICLQ